MSLKIAVAHHYVSPDVRENGQRIRALMRDAKAAGAQLVHFPEGAASGYIKTQVTDWKTVDWLALREELESIAALADKLALWVVVGANHRLNAHRPHNSMYVISDQGGLIGRYDKRLCSFSEITDWYSPGVDPFVFDVNGIRFGCAICIELSFSAPFAEYRRLGVHCMLLSSYSNDAGDEVKARGQAAVHNMWFSLSRPINPQPPGCSAIYGPDGSVIAQTLSGQPALATAVVDLDDPHWQVPIAFARPWRDQAALGKIYEEHRVEDPRSTDKLAF